MASGTPPDAPAPQGPDRAGTAGAEGAWPRGSAPAPTAAEVAPAVNAIRSVGRDLWRTFFADPVRENVLRSGGGGPAGRTTIGLGVAAFLVAALLVVLGSRLGAAPIGPGSATLGRESAPGDPVSIPLLLYPVLMSLLLASTAVGLFGAAYAKRRLAIIATILVTLPALLLGGFVWDLRGLAWPGWFALPVACAMPLAVVLLRWRSASPALAQVVAVALAGASIVPAAAAALLATTADGAAGGIPLLGDSIANVLALLALLVAPVAALAGAGAISFARTVTDYVARSVDTLTGSGVTGTVIAYLVVLAWSVVVGVRGLLGATSPGRSVVKLAVAVLLLAAAAWWWRWATRASDETAEDVDAAAGRGAPVVALVLFLQVAPLVLALALAHVETAVFSSGGLVRVANALSDAIGHAWYGTTYVLIVGSALALGSALIARARPGVLAGWSGLAGAVMVLTVAWNSLLTSPEWGGLGIRDLARAASLVLVVGTAAWGVARLRGRAGMPTPVRLRIAFSLAGLAGLVGTDFVEDPFQPLLGFTGIGLVFFGVVWGFLTSGAHAKVAGLPGLGRSAVLLSYAVLTTTLVAWGYATGGEVWSTVNSQFGQVGRNVLGVTALLGLAAVWLPEVLAPAWARCRGPG